MGKFSKDSSKHRAICKTAWKTEKVERRGRLNVWNYMGKGYYAKENFG